MRIVIAAALAVSSAALAPEPSHATVGLLCKAPGGARPWISLIFAAGGGSLAGAALDENGRWRSTMGPDRRLVLADRSVDLERVSVRLLDLRGRPVAHLRARLATDGRGRGMLTVRGRSRPVICAQD